MSAYLKANKSFIEKNTNGELVIKTRCTPTTISESITYVVNGTSYLVHPKTFKSLTKRLGLISQTIVGNRRNINVPLNEVPFAWDGETLTKTYNVFGV